MTQEQDRIQRKLRELIGDDRIRIVDASNAAFIDDAGRERRSRSESEVRHFNQVRDRVFKPPLEDESSEIADVAVLLSCEKEDKYEYWITYLGNDRKDRFAYVGELPKRLQTEQYWAWESGQGGRFEFNPYAGATGGGISISTTPTNHDGAIIEAGPQGSFYQSEGWNGGGDKGGTVTPRWSKVLSDYEVTARTYLQTLCYPLTQYTDVTWEWSDGGGGYALRKVPGNGVTTSSRGKTIGTRWEVSWSHAEGGGGVSASQVGSPRVVADNQAILPTYNLVLSNGRSWSSKIGFGVEESVRNKPWEPGLGYRYKTCGGGSLPGGVFLPDTDLAVSKYIYGGVGGLEGAWFRPGYNPVGLWGPDAGSGYLVLGSFGDLCGTMPFGGSYLPKGAFVSPTLEAEVYKLDGSPYVIQEKRLIVSEGDKILYDSGWGDSVPSKEAWTDPPGESYTIRVFDENEIELDYDSASSPISYSLEKIERKLVSFFISKDGENINGQFDASAGRLPDGFEDGDEGPEEYRYFDIGPDDELPSVKGETNLITAKVEAWVEVNEKELAKIYLDGKDGQNIVESSAYEEATKPYTGPNGRTVFPCYPQKTEDNPLKEEKKSFQRGEGFNAYHTTFYASYDESGDLVEWTPFDFGNPDLSGYLPSPSINYLYSLVSTDLLVSYDPVARLSWGVDIPEENPETGETTNLEEEQIDGIDKNGVLYPLVKGFTYGLYGPIKAGNTLLNQLIDKQAGQSLANYDMNGWNYRNRARKPRTYVLGPDDFEEGEPFEEYDITDPDQRGLHQMQMTMGRTFRQSLWGYDLGPIGNEREEDWRHQAATFANVTSGGSTPNQRRFFNDPAFNSSNVRQSGDKRVDIKVNMDDVKALLKAAERKDVRFTVYPEGGGDDAEPTEKIFKMNPIQDVFEGYEEVKILAVAGIIY